MKIHGMDATITEVNDENRIKDEQLFEYSGRNYNLEQKIEAKYIEHSKDM